MVDFLAPPALLVEKLNGKCFCKSLYICQKLFHLITKPSNL